MSRGMRSTGFGLVAVASLTVDVASYVALGDNEDETTVDNCIDNDLKTHTTMGNTVGQTERLRVTLGFESTSGPPPR